MQQPAQLQHVWLETEQAPVVTLGQNGVISQDALLRRPFAEKLAQH